MPRTSRPSNPLNHEGDNTPPSTGLAAPAELVVVVAPEAGIRATPTGITSVENIDIAPLAQVLQAESIRLEPLFGIHESRLKLEALQAVAPAGLSMPDLSVYYRVDAPEDRLESLATRLRQVDTVVGAYVKPPTIYAVTAEPPLRTVALNAMLPQAEVAPPMTPQFTAQQGYLDAAPDGIEARWAWTQPGGAGADVRIVDVEGEWRFTHEDLAQNQGGVIGGTPPNSIDWRNHGTAVLGEFSGDDNTFGITGICPDANVSGVSVFGAGMSSAAAIRHAADAVRPGDILLIELHRPGPRFNFANRNDQRGYIAVEWWPDDFDAIRYAVTRGVVVVEAAGNGAEDLDDALYNTRPAGFPTSWTNPFQRANRDAGAVVVGAGAPPSGNFGPDRSRLDFSNYGALIDAQGWGREVTTCGYGDLQGGMSEDAWYTSGFSGTSSASPIVVGALGSVQGGLRAGGRIPLSPARARELLRATGSPQQDAPGRPATQRIGNRPNLRQLFAQALQTTSWSGVQFTGTLGAGQTQGWFTFGWPAQWHVVWTVVPTTPNPGNPSITWRVQVERASDAFITYWINITNSATATTDFEARFAVLGW